MRMYRLREEDKKYLYALLYATGLILFWRGVWEVSYEIPLLENVYFVFFVGLFILTITGFIYRDYTLLSKNKDKILRILDDAIIQTKRGASYTVYYYDEQHKGEQIVNLKLFQKIESDFVVYNNKGHDAFIPITRITKIKKGTETIWSN